MGNSQQSGSLVRIVPTAELIARFKKKYDEAVQSAAVKPEGSRMTWSRVDATRRRKAVSQAEY
jgi:hypothetical protein